MSIDSRIARVEHLPCCLLTASHLIALQRMLTVLHVAAKEGRADACRMLLRAGADCLEEMTVREREDRI